MPMLIHLILSYLYILSTFLGGRQIRIYADQHDKSTGWRLWMATNLWLAGGVLYHTFLRVLL